MRERDKRRVKQLCFSVLAFGLVFLGQTFFSQSNAPSSTPPPAPIPVAVVSSTTTNALITNVVDGDTVEVLPDGAKDSIKIRLLGVNTPETVDPRKPVECFGKEASAFAHVRLDAQRVRVESDFQADDIDKYGRYLRNIFLADGTDFNLLLVREGYAYAYLYFPLTPARKVEIKRLEEEAKTAGRGLWAPGACQGAK